MKHSRDPTARYPVKLAWCRRLSAVARWDTAPERFCDLAFSPDDPRNRREVSSRQVTGRSPIQQGVAQTLPKSDNAPYEPWALFHTGHHSLPALGA